MIKNNFFIIIFIFLANKLQFCLSKNVSFLFFIFTIIFYLRSILVLRLVSKNVLCCEQKFSIIDPIFIPKITPKKEHQANDNKTKTCIIFARETIKHK